ncbi:hypothetical protein M011DRAFT_172585 [Sporormia fimetaria CBS 119925]|uniref:Myb-like domain-containing protein n=1 Tax=Sporormia fimetaria CBS 119925 TaxID=1340428 RepID=A0A6A6V3I5_9PLEO|nr:hypothetical protein M011DRAFT_172585 [Sporormia fimetaria CBS 119925]
MSGSESDYEPINESSEPSLEPEDRPSSRPESRARSVASTSSRKRRRTSRSTSVESVPDRRELQGHYRDEYRTLLNTTIDSANARFEPAQSFRPLPAQIGIAHWSSQEKITFFAALERLGSDDVPGIAKAIGTKSIPEVRQFLLLLQDATEGKRHPKVMLRDIPAAAEISSECTDRLELAGDALAWYQERFEAKREQDRFGSYWLITPDIAEQVEEALLSSRRTSVVSSPTSDVGGTEGDQDMKPQVDPIVPQIIEDIPEANLLNTSALLTLSSEFFMNGSPNAPSWFPHWSTMASPLASEPSIYRTALMDFQALVISLTRRIVQTSIVQATSRIRSQGWRVKKGVHPLVKKRDVLTAIDVLNLPNNAQERWRRVARRCGLRVFDGEGRHRREMDWKEVEEVLNTSTFEPDSFDSGDEPTTPTPVDADFKARAMRSGTPLPAHGLANTAPSSEESEESDDSVVYSDVIDEDAPADGVPASSLTDIDEWELRNLETMDQSFSREEECRLLDMLEVPPDGRGHLTLVPKIEELDPIPQNRKMIQEEGWRTWIEYHAQWEEQKEPVPAQVFAANQKSPSPVPLPSIEDALESSHDSGAESLRNTRRKKRRKVAGMDIPIRGTRQYAALHERASGSEGRQSEDQNAVGEEQWIAPSIENPGVD